jgi:hypothetical protein
MIEFLVSSIVGVISGIFWLAFTAFMIWMIVDCACMRRGSATNG